MCSENEICADELADSTQNSAVFENSSPEDVCPIQSAVKMTVQERTLFKFEPVSVSEKFSAHFSPTKIIPDSFKIQLEFYLSPKFTSQNKRPFKLRI